MSTEKRIPPEGFYDGDVISAVMTADDKGRENVNMRLALTDESGEQYSIWQRFYQHTEGCAPVTAEKLALMGWRGDEPMTFDGRAFRVRIVVNQNGYAEVAGIYESKGSGGPKPSTLAPAQLKSAAARMRALMIQQQQANGIPSSVAPRGQQQRPPQPAQQPAAPQQPPQRPRAAPPLPGAQHPAGVPQGRGAGGYRPSAPPPAYQGGEERLDRGHGQIPQGDDDDIPFDGRRW